MSQLLPLNSTPLERALATACDLGIDPEIIRGVADSTRCPVDFLPWLAWAMSVEGWDAAEDEDQQRALIRESIPVHKRKGTVGAVRRVLKAVGVIAEFREWTEIAGAVPYTFELTAWANSNREGEGSVLSPGLYQRLKALIDATKNERSHYELVLGAGFTGGLAIGAGVRVVRVSRFVAASADSAINAESGLAIAGAVRLVRVVRFSMEREK